MRQGFAYPPKKVKPTPRAIGSIDCRAARVTPAADLQAVLIELLAAGGQPPIVECPRVYQRLPVLAAVAHAGGDRRRAARELGLTTAGLRVMLRRWRRQAADAQHRMAVLVREAG